MNNFYDWFTTFLEEKEIDMSEYLAEGIQVGDVCQAIVDTTPEEQEKIKDTLVMIDFKNGNIIHYFKHLSQALSPGKVAKRKGEMAEEIFDRKPKSRGR